MDGSGDGQMMVSWSGEVQVRVKSQKYSELDIVGHDTCHNENIVKPWLQILSPKDPEFIPHPNKSHLHLNSISPKKTGADTKML